MLASNTLLLDGKALSAEIREELKAKLLPYLKQGQRPPRLAAVLVGNNPASASYVRNKIRACKDTGFESELISLPAQSSEADILKCIEQLNKRSDLDGYIVQLPLPDGISEERINEAISPSKDVDGFHPINIGKMTLRQNSILPATPYGILLLLSRYKIDTEGKHCVVLGRSNIVGRPMSILMSRAGRPGNATVTLLHSRSKDMAEHCRRADILIAAVGKPEFIGKEMIKPGAVLIDVGINSVADPDAPRGYRLVGDLNYQEALPLASAITPVPGGVGPMTIAALLLNTFELYEQNIKKT